MVKPLEHSVLCKQEEDLGSDEEEEKVKVVEKVEEKEKARKEEKARKGKGKGKGEGKKGKGKRLRRIVCRICHQKGHWGTECPNRHSVRHVEAEEQNQGGEVYAHKPPNQDQYPRPNVVESGSIRQTTSRPDPRVVTRRVRENFTLKPFYHIGTPPEEFPEDFL